MRVLITGGSGYLGQFLLQALTPHHDTAYTYLSTPLPQGGARAFRADLATGEGLQEAVLGFRPHAVVNCAAVAQPAACERDYAACLAVNRPQQLVAALQRLQDEGGLAALLVHVSTDQVYDGSRAWWAEADPAQPVNAYGRSKLAAEQLLAEAWPGRHVCLRSSLIYGPEPPLLAVQRPLFLQFMRDVLSKGAPTTFFTDEYRCAVYVSDICAIVAHIIDRCSRIQQQQAEGAPTGQVAAEPAACSLADLPHSIYNMGGPDRLSRHDMAMAVAQHLHLDSAAVLPAKSSEVHRGYESPPDISMKVDRLLEDMPGICLTPFSAALQQLFPAAAAP